MDYYKKITRLQRSDKHVLHNYETDFYEFSPELIKKNTHESDSFSENKDSQSCFVSHKISL